ARGHRPRGRRGHGDGLVHRGAGGQDPHRVAPVHREERGRHRVRRGGDALHGGRRRGVLVGVDPADHRKAQRRRGDFPHRDGVHRPRGPRLRAGRRGRARRGDRPMDLMHARVALRERPLLDTFDLAIRFCAAHAWAYTKLSLVVLVPAFAVSWGAARFGGWWLGWSVSVVVTAFA